MNKILLPLLVFFIYVAPTFSQNTDIFSFLTKERKEQSKEEDGSWPDLSEWKDSKMQFEFTAETITISKGEPLTKVGAWHINNKQAESVNDNGDIINSWNCQSGEDHFIVQLWKRSNTDGNFYYQFYLFDYNSRIVYNVELILPTEVSSTKEEKEYYDNGNLKTIGKLENGKKVGEWKSFYENGELNTLMIYNDDNDSGILESYYENGKINVTGKFEGKDKKGEWLSYYENGILEGVSNYKDGERTGEWREYFKNGNPYSIKKYIDGVEIGEWKYYNENGNLELVENYKNGEKHGESREYRSNGILILVTIYEEGDEIDSKYYNENGVEEE